MEFDIEKRISREKTFDDLKESIINKQISPNQSN